MALDSSLYIGPKSIDNLPCRSSRSSCSDIDVMYVLNLMLAHHASNNFIASIATPVETVSSASQKVFFLAAAEPDVGPPRIE